MNFSKTTQNNTNFTTKAPKMNQIMAKPPKASQIIATKITVSGKNRTLRVAQKHHDVNLCHSKTLKNISNNLVAILLGGALYSLVYIKQISLSYI